MWALVRIEALHFVAGLILEGEPGKVWVCVKAAPILGYMHTKRFSAERIKAYCDRKGWTFQIVEIYQCP